MEPKEIMNDLNEKPRLLIVDDDRNFHKTLRGILSKLNYRVVHCYTGQEAILTAEKEFFHIALIDYRLGEVHGLNVAEKLKSVNPHTGIILITGYATLETAIDSIRKGIDYFLTKPVDPKILIHGISQVLLKQSLLMERKSLIKDLREANDRLENTSRSKTGFARRLIEKLNTSLPALRRQLGVIRDMSNTDNSDEKRQKMREAVYVLDTEIREMEEIAGRGVEE